MERSNLVNTMDVYGNYGYYKCNIGKAMDQAGITISKMRKMTGLNHEIVKKYYEDQVVRIDKDVFARMSYVLNLHGGSIENLLEYVPPKKDDENKSTK